MAINKESITNQVYNMIKESIINQELELGQKINTREIAEKNGISIMPVRDALLKLVNQGYIINRPRVGFFVRSFSDEEMYEIVEVRKMYEFYSLENHFDNIDRVKLKDLYAYFEIDVKSPGDFFNIYDTQLHTIIVEASGNNFLIERYKKLIDYSSLLFSCLNNQRYKESNEEHIEIIESVISNRKDKAIKILRKHLEKVKIDKNLLNK